MANFNDFTSMEWLKKCDDTWDCSHGKCTPQEKALRLCLSRVKPEPYDCDYVPGKPEWGVATESKHFTQGLPMFLGCVLFLVGAGLFLYCMVDHVDRGTASCFAASMVIFAVLFTWAAWRSHAEKRPPPKIQHAAELGEPCTTGEYHMCGMPTPEDPPWNHALDQLPYYLFTCFVWILPLCFFGCFAALSAGLNRALAGQRSSTREDERTPLNQQDARSRADDEAFVSPRV